ncbi:hypothetical protein [Leptospirillum ferrooxidans]|uniref:Uncharacterized protein n=1 Tax=Leptospirillum ferrooxidans (strain C2-3) TaxID=1162668 RepID=I0IR53_LEPFC|nr:hypothetical protein [Leptospirillum ferrooxidans]BAM07752.1 hypothetical protein LFE_2079 [Leptospirillum ferrooxidans C2-3]
MPLQNNDCAQSLPASLSVYPSDKKEHKDERITRITFFLAFAGVGLFSVTRLFLIHWVWLIPVSLGFLTLLAIVLLAMRVREKPKFTLRVEREQLCIDTGTTTGEATSHCYPVGEVTARRLPGTVDPPESFALIFEGMEICECHLFGVRNVSLYQDIFEYFSLPAGERPEMTPEKERLPRKKLSWFLLAYGLIALILTLWAAYEHQNPEIGTTFPRP